MRIPATAALAFLTGAWCVAADCGGAAGKAKAARDGAQLQQAVLLYRRALECDPRWAEGWWDLGTILYERDRYAEAAAAFERSATLAPKNGDTFVMLGLSEAKLGRKRNALEHLARGRRLGLREDPQFLTVAWFTEGTLLLEAGSFGLAQERFEALASAGSPASELSVPLGRAVLGILPAGAGANPVSADVVRRAGEAQYLAAQRDVPAAKAAWAALVSERPDVPQMQFAYGRFLLAIHENDEAVRAFQAEISRSPKHVLAHLGIAGTRANSDAEFALPYAETAVQLAPRLAESHYLLGSILLKLDRLARAIRELETARTLAPRQAKIHFELARAYRMAGRRAEAAHANELFVKFGGASEQSLPGVQK